MEAAWAATTTCWAHYPFTIRPTCRNGIFARVLLACLLRHRRNTRPSDPYHTFFTTRHRRLRWLTDVQLYTTRSRHGIICKEELNSWPPWYSLLRECNGLVLCAAQTNQNDTLILCRTNVYLSERRRERQGRIEERADPIYFLCYPSISPDSLDDVLVLLFYVLFIFIITEKKYSSLKKKHKFYSLKSVLDDEWSCVWAVQISEISPLLPHFCFACLYIIPPKLCPYYFLPFLPSRSLRLPFSSSQSPYFNKLSNETIWSPCWRRKMLGSFYLHPQHMHNNTYHGKVLQLILLGYTNQNGFHFFRRIQS